MNMEGVVCCAQIVWEEYMNDTVTSAGDRLCSKLREELKAGTIPDGVTQQKTLYSRIKMIFSLSDDQLIEHITHFGCTETAARAWVQHGSCPSSRYQELCRFLAEYL